MTDQGLRAPDPNAPRADTRLVSRRQAIGLGVGAGVVATAAGAATFAFASGENPTMTVWQLAADWDTPRGPNRKRGLESLASRNAAAFRYALSEADALNMNLHVGSWAPAVPVLVDERRFRDLWDRLSYEWTNPWNGRVVRLFDARHEAGARFTPVPTPTAEPTPEPTVEPTPDPTPEPTAGPTPRPMSQPTPEPTTTPPTRPDQPIGPPAAEPTPIIGAPIGNGDSGVQSPPRPTRPTRPTGNGPSAGGSSDTPRRPAAEPTATPSSTIRAPFGSPEPTTGAATDPTPIADPGADTVPTAPTNGSGSPRIDLRDNARGSSGGGTGSGGTSSSPGSTGAPGTGAASSSSTRLNDGRITPLDEEAIGRLGTPTSPSWVVSGAPGGASTTTATTSTGGASRPWLASLGVGAAVAAAGAAVLFRFRERQVEEAAAASRANARRR